MTLQEMLGGSPLSHTGMSQEKTNGGMRIELPRLGPPKAGFHTGIRACLNVNVKHCKL